MNNQSKKSPFSTKFGLINFVIGILIGLPLLTTFEANADLYNSEMSTEKDAIESENLEVDNNTDGGYDGEPIATISPTEGTVNVMVKNNTNAAIDYQAIGYTENQTLEGGNEHTMKDLPVPVVIRMARQDDGFIKMQPKTDNSEVGMLEVSLNEDPDFYDDDNLGVIRIEEDGSVYLN